MTLNAAVSVNTAAYLLAVQESAIYVLAAAVTHCLGPVTSLHVHTCAYHPQFSGLNVSLFFSVFDDGSHK